jgi:alginate O-acetyltransferase complex protein AlgI
MPDLPVLITRAATLIFVFLAWTIFRAHTFNAALNMYSGQFGLQGYWPSETLNVLLRPVHWLALALGILSILAPWIYSKIKHHFPKRLLTIAGLWPVIGFLLSYSLIASRGATPFLYFQF